MIKFCRAGREKNSEFRCQHERILFSWNFERLQFLHNESPHSFHFHHINPFLHSCFLFVQPSTTDRRIMNLSTTSLVTLILLVLSTSVQAFVSTPAFVTSQQQPPQSQQALFYSTGAAAVGTVVKPPTTVDKLNRQLNHRNKLANKKIATKNDPIAGIIGLTDATLRHKVRRFPRKIKRKPSELKMIARSTATKAFRDGQKCAERALKEVLLEYGITDKILV